MNSIRQKKLIWVFLTLSGSIVAITLILYAIREQTNFYFDPTAIVSGKAPTKQTIRAGGMVVPGSIKRDPQSVGDALSIEFKITDCKSTIKVKYHGILPDLFVENSGVVATGKLENTYQINATEILAKHDENYIPPDVAKSIKSEHKKGINGCKSNDNVQLSIKTF